MTQSRQFFNLLSLLPFCLSTLPAVAEPPYSGTIFIENGIITDKDPSSFMDLTNPTTGLRSVFDRRNGGAWVDITAYLFTARYSDGPDIEVIVNPEFASVDAARTEALTYAREVGRLPKCLRDGILKELWIHQGTEPFGGGNKALLIHTGQAYLYTLQGILEETLVHEACHTSLDFAHESNAGWLAAQQSDGEFISTYARDNPGQEDIAESFLLYFAAIYRPSRISEETLNTVTQTIPARIEYFEAQDFGLGAEPPSAPFAISLLTVDPPSGDVEISWQSSPDTNYTIEFSTNLTRWSDLVLLVPSEGTQTSHQFNAVLPTDGGYFRIRELP